MVDQAYAEVQAFWKNLSQTETDSELSQVSAFEVLVEKLKSKLGDLQVLSFFDTMMTTDTHYR